VASVSDLRQIGLSALYSSVGPLRIDKIDRPGRGNLKSSSLTRHAHHIKRLSLHIINDAPDVVAGMLKAFRALRDAIIPDKLQMISFTMMTRVSPQFNDILRDILATQTRIHTIMLPTMIHTPCDITCDLSPFSAWLKIRHTGVKGSELNIFIRKDSDLTIARDLIRRGSAVESMVLWGTRQYTRPQVIGFFLSLGISLPLQVPEVEFYFFDPSVLIGLVFVPQIKRLALHNSVGHEAVQVYLGSIAYGQAPIEKLVYKQMINRKGRHGIEVDGAFFHGLLNRLPSGLKQVLISEPRESKIPPVQFVERHKTTIELISIRFADRAYTAAEIEAVVNACKKLRGIAIYCSLPMKEIYKGDMSLEKVPEGLKTHLTKLAVCYFPILISSSPLRMTACFTVKPRLTLFRCLR
jgi:hypothetical protein